MWRVLLVALVACQSKCAEDPPAPAAPTAPAAHDSAAVAATDAAAVARPLEGVVLQTVAHACAWSKLDDCGIPDIATDAQATAIALPGCSLAAALELRELSQYTKRCALVLRRGDMVIVADTLSICSSWDSDTAKSLPRIRIERATCATDVVDVVLATIAGHMRTRVQCRPGAGDSIACVREPRLELGGPQLAAFLADVERVTEAHQWDALLELCSADHRKAQMGEMHQDKATYLAEILGLHSVGNSLTDNRVTFDDLKRIEQLTLVEIVAEGDGWYSIIGIVTVKSHPPLRLELRVSTHGGRPRLDGALG